MGARFEDSRLVPGDLLDGRSERFDVIETDRGNHADAGLDHVGHIEATTGARFDHRHVDAAGREGGGNQCHPELAVGERGIAGTRDRVEQGVHLGGEPPGRDQPVGDLQFFGGDLEIRRGVEPGTEAGRTQDFGDEGRGRAFAGCTGDVNHRRRQVGIADVGEKDAQTFQLGGRPVLQGRPRERVGDGGFDEFVGARDGPFVAGDDLGWIRWHDRSLRGAPRSIWSGRRRFGCGAYQGVRESHRAAP